MITWVIIFTGRLVTITNQYETPYCVAHAVATCGSFYWYDSNPETYIKKLWIWKDWYKIDLLANSLYKLRISKPKTLTFEKVVENLKKWPILLDFQDWAIVNKEEVKKHLTCAVWYDNNYIYIANSYGTWWGYNWYGRIASWEVSKLKFMTIWNKNLAPTQVKLFRPKTKK